MMTNPVELAVDLLRVSSAFGKCVTRAGATGILHKGPPVAGSPGWLMFGSAWLLDSAKTPWVKFAKLRKRCTGRLRNSMV